MLSQEELETAVRVDFKNAILEIFKTYKVLTISTNWSVLDKTYGEVGGRFLEDFLLSELKAKITELPKYHIVDAYAPDGRRTMEDIVAQWEIPDVSRQRLLISIKGHKTGSASNPNLVSLQKAKVFYASHPANTHFLLLILHYLPERIVKDGFNMYIQEVGLFHLKDLAEHHLSLQTIGSGGQFLLTGIDKIQESYRTTQDFYEMVCRKEVVWLAKKGNKHV